MDYFKCIKCIQLLMGSKHRLNDLCVWNMLNKPLHSAFQTAAEESHFDNVCTKIRLLWSVVERQNRLRLTLWFTSEQTKENAFSLWVSSTIVDAKMIAQLYCTIIFQQGEGFLMWHWFAYRALFMTLQSSIHHYWHFLSPQPWEVEPGLRQPSRLKIIQWECHIPKRAY